MRENSVLSNLLKAQQIDNIGIVRAYKYFNKLPIKVQVIILVGMDLTMFFGPYMFRPSHNETGLKLSKFRPG